MNFNPYNYTSKVLESLDLIRDSDFYGAKGDEAITDTIAAIERCEKFMLAPDLQGHIFDSKTRLEFHDFIIPPYDEMLLEYHLDEQQDLPPEQTRMPCRMVLIQTCSSQNLMSLILRSPLSPTQVQCLKAISQDADDRGAMLITPFFSQDKSQWIPACLSFAFPIAPTICRHGKTQPAFLGLSGSRLGPDSEGVVYLPVDLGFFEVPFKHASSIDWTSKEDFIAGAIRDSVSESIPVIDQLIALNTDNANILKTPERSFINKRREKKGKRPLYSYHYLDVPSPRYEKKAKQGTHASPRMHKRRGHIRRLASRKITWVRPSVVGKIQNGIVEKSYVYQEEQSA